MDIQRVDSRITVSALIKSLFFLGLFMKAHAHTISYVPGTEDIPLIEGARPEENPTFFDKPEGRVVIATVESTASYANIEAFYKKTLLNLGWIETSKNNYSRESQKLDITIQNHGSRAIITFELRENSGL